MMIVFDSVTKKYGTGTVALDSVSFVVEPKEFVILQGHSGSGKTTIQKLLLKETSPSSGQLKVDGDTLDKISSKNLPLLRRKVGVIFQDFRIMFDKTVRENVALVLDILGIEKDIADHRLEELLVLTGLSGKGEMFPIQLSGGELQRVAIARALAPEPKIIFADEPTGNLDDVTGKAIVELLMQINDQGTTILMATHDKHLVKNYHLRTIELERGKLISDLPAKKNDQT
ncbi:MAG: ATP-binding cassette domain-containing protein [bacterium]